MARKEPSRLRKSSSANKRRRSPGAESLEARKKRARQVFRRLARAYPDARCSLDYSSPLELLVATVLSAQCTDTRVNQVTPALFTKYRTAADYARAPAGELERDIRQTGFFNSKATVSGSTTCVLPVASSSTSSIRRPAVRSRHNAVHEGLAKSIIKKLSEG